MIRDDVLARVARDLTDVWQQWAALYDPTDEERRLARTLVINSFGGVDVPDAFTSKPEHADALNYSRIRLMGLEHAGNSARKIRELFDHRWQSMPSKPLSFWLKTADRPTLLKVESLLREGLGYER